MKIEAHDHIYVEKEKDLGTYFCRICGFRVPKHLIDKENAYCRKVGIKDKYTIKKTENTTCSLCSNTGWVKDEVIRDWIACPNCKTSSGD
jgi:hypothetical protein